MITPNEIKDKTEKKYLLFLKSVINNEQFSKILIRGDKNYTKSSLSEFEKELLLLNSHSKEKRGFGYTIEFQKVKTKHLGVQDLPIAIYYNSLDDFLKYLGKEKEVKIFGQDSNEILKQFPILKEWAIKNPIKIIQNKKNWDNILRVCNYFKENPKPRLYIRELPINVHTKFIEKNQSIIRELLDIIIFDYANKQEIQFEKRFNLKYSEPQVRFKILDKEISQKFFLGIDDIAIPVTQFETMFLPINKVLIVENKTTLYTTLTLPEMNGTIAIFGSGYSVNNLKNVSWFKDIELLYWGDIDVQGFEILSQFRNYHQHVKSILMDKETFHRFFENDLGTISNIGIQLNISEHEKLLYDHLKINNWRLEQEKIPLAWVVEKLKFEQLCR
jgi:hypothetical protein